MRAAQLNWKFGCLAVLLLSACGGEFAYKQGAGADQLAEARQACQKSGEPYEACMNAKGWKVHKLDDDNPLAVFVPTGDPRGGGQEQVYVPAKGPINTPYVAPQTASADVAKSPPAVTTAAAPEKKSPPDPLTRFNVSSWWKMGSGADDLKASTDTCVAKLGPAHQPEIEKKLYTRGLILCLKEQGWYGLQGY